LEKIFIPKSADGWDNIPTNSYFLEYYSTIHAIFRKLFFRIDKPFEKMRARARCKD
jgi:hypothetical protein